VAVAAQESHGLLPSSGLTYAEPLKDEMLVLGNELIRATTAPGTSPQFGPTARDTHRDGQSAERMA
jgi:hypothetical protein